MEYYFKIVEEIENGENINYNEKGEHVEYGDSNYKKHYFDSREQADIYAKKNALEIFRNSGLKLSNPCTVYLCNEIEQIYCKKSPAWI